jgi:hydrogenase nickel incorporation protein HypB
MCDTCGCGSTNKIIIQKPGQLQQNHEHEHDHTHALGHSHEHPHDHHHSHTDHSNKLNIETNILNQNDLLAERNRGFFLGRNIYAVNLVSSPGSGKTSLLEKTLKDLKNEIEFNIIEGDQQTFNDANRIDALGIPVVQINTGTGCHLDSDMVHKAMQQLDPPANSILMIENVGNLVCPSLFDLGENERIVIISVTEGDDKPIKYPDMFHGSQVCIINKIDLLPYVNFSVEKAKDYARKVNPDLIFFEVSATKGDGLNDWYEYLRSKMT